MDILLGSSVVQIAGVVIVTAALLQAAVMFYASWQRLGQEKTHRELSLELLRRRVEGETAQRQFERDRETAVWSGMRKFRLREKIDEGGRVCSFYLVPHDGKPLPPFYPGQYLTFQLNIPGQAKPIIRCYSLSDSANPDYYRVSIKALPPPPDKPDAPHGLVSNFFRDQVNEGDILDAKAPGGHFFLNLAEHTPVVLIAGGIGLTPLFSMLNAICGSGSTRETWLFYGTRNSSEHFMKEHLERLATENDNVRLQVCYSHALDIDVKGKDYQQDGFVSVELLTRLLPSNNYEFYICGPPPMMNVIVPDLKAWGVPDADIHFEAFGPATVAKTKATKPAEEGTAGAAIEVLFARSGKTCNWDPEAGSLLDFAEANDVVIDSGCRAGNCGTCITAIRSGEVEYLIEHGAEPESGSCLTCVTVPKTNLTLDA